MSTLLIDDTRNMTADFTARSFQEGIDALKYLGPWDLLLLDHDLASFNPIDNKELTGYDIAKFLESHPEFRPSKIQIITMNPVGRLNISNCLKGFYTEKLGTWELSI